ncbi:stage III sporulation protein AH [Caloranaerobacter azorensis DSM 13643]|uniref:Stage III sporulation protein AH n=1 Tax=Caloranaerobacter azorensis DSM 13643 TaxID=1121264 RepID=A0A1M5RY91_9FIRM|nr:SpoIIIAH-like family protein [Caloranaerobacter azorensis]SHH30998.1 stage III sporulation protein AH [Caloranaerobacter azorensis DSM 13643]
MVIKKRTLLLVSLLIALTIIGYINHSITKQALLETTSEYERYEDKKLEDVFMDDSKIVETSADYTKNENEEVVDSKDNAISSISNKIESKIEENIIKEENRKSNNYFVEYRLSRDKLRANLVERLNDIVNNEKTDEETRKKAQEEIMRIGNISEKELLIEGLIKAKGFEDVLVFLKNDSVRVIVSADVLNEQDVIKILEIVKSETNLEPSAIKIMKKY